MTAMLVSAVVVVTSMIVVVMRVMIVPMSGVIMIAMRVLCRVPGHNVIPEGGEPRWNPLKTL